MGEQSEHGIGNSALNAPHQDAVRLVQRVLKSKVPKVSANDLPEQTQDSARSIEELNAKAISTFLEVLTKNESERINQQRPLQTWLLIFVGLQLLFFNGIIGYLILFRCSSAGVQVISEVLDFMKYYIGAVLAELLGMILLITKSTFSSPSQDIIKGFFSRISK